ncbi:PD-(D/E)XK nuclease family protein [Sphingobacterium corticis]|uniref:PD-(D/E)XK nuclease family protein n=1 Tax=Sphingobacterium corticis TaxID=1812823 RepID=A0ABW5NPA6_9SPHI
MNIPKLLSDLSELKNHYDRKEDRLNTNLFALLHKIDEEVKLHSRFISYLLSPKSSHGMRDQFLNQFLKILNVPTQLFDSSLPCVIIPNEANIIEYREIDILIKNTNKQAIIIENKINASDSIHPDKPCGYRGQLERYYNTILTGKDAKGKYDPNHHCKDVSVFYLSNNKPLNPETVGCAKNVRAINYSAEIRNWLQNCINIIPSDNYPLIYNIKQYLNLVNKMTYNDLSKNEKLELKDYVANDLQASKYLVNNFKHVKWHAIDDFWMYLKGKLENMTGKEVFLYPEGFAKAITNTTHLNKPDVHGVTFWLNDSQCYICHDANGLTWGDVSNPEENRPFQHQSVAGIRFDNFELDSTFDVINSQNKEQIVNQILVELQS